MEKISRNQPWPEIVFGSSDSKKSQAIRRAIHSGELKKLSAKLYTSNLKDKPEQIIKRNLYHILGELFPGAVLSHRTALEAGPSKDNVVFLTYKYTKNISLPGLTVRLLQGQEAMPGDTPFIANLFLASRERALLENLQTSRQRETHAKTLPRTEIESYLDRLCNSYGVEELNRVRDKAKTLSKKLHFEKEFKILDKIIGALLGTKESTLLQTSQGKARASIS